MPQRSGMDPRVKPEDDEAEGLRNWRRGCAVSGRACAISCGTARSAEGWSD